MHNNITITLSHSLPPIDAQHGQEGRPCRHGVPKLQKSCELCSLKHNSTSLHPPYLLATS